MSLLQQIQETVVNESLDLSSVLLKVRILAGKLGSNILEKWVKYESEGYPEKIEVPFYRKANVSYRGTFLGKYGSEVKDAQIPTYLIKECVGDRNAIYEIRDSIATVEEIIKNSKGGKSVKLNVYDIMPLLHGKIYDNLSCHEINASISSTNFYEIKQIVRNRILELTIELEKSVPGAINVKFGSSAPNKEETEQVQQISQQIIHGNVHTAVSGFGSVAITEGDSESFIEYLVKSGILKSDASKLAKIMETENPKSAEEPFGERTQEWISNNIKNAMNGTWKIGMSVVSKVLTEAIIKFHGL